LKAHPDNNESAILIPYLGERIDEGLNILSPRIKNSILSSYYIPYKRELENRKLREDASKKMTTGAIAPDFTVKDIKGNDFSLASLRGKYVLLDFWGSWCHWCLKGMPELKKYYEKYKGKFEIVGVDCNDTEEKWKAAVEKNQLPWIQVKSEAANSVSSKYGVEGYPTLIIIDPSGKVVKKFLGEDSEFFTTLDTMFK
jgi:thiol-disulfide isomerase/thioredoxin